MLITKNFYFRLLERVLFDLNVNFFSYIPMWHKTMKVKVILNVFTFTARLIFITFLLRIVNVRNLPSCVQSGVWVIHLTLENSNIVSEIVFQTTDSSSASFDNIGLTSNDNDFLQLVPNLPLCSVSILFCVHKNSLQGLIVV